MNYKALLRILALMLALMTTLALASCGDKNDGGDMTEQSGVSKSDTDNTVDKKEDHIFVQGYYNWIYSSAFNGFKGAIKSTKLPAEIEEPFASLAEEKKISQLKNIFCSTEVISAIQTASEYEGGKGKYTHDVTFVKRSAKGIYSINMKVTTGATTTERIYELQLKEGTRAVKLTCYNDNAEELYFHEIVLTNDGYLAVNRANLSEGKWSTLQLLYKAEGTEGGNCTLTSNLTEMPKSIYQESVYSGFAGKN